MLLESLAMMAAMEAINTNEQPVLKMNWLLNHRRSPSSGSSVKRAARQYR